MLRNPDSRPTGPENISEYDFSLYDSAPTELSPLERELAEALLAAVETRRYSSSLAASASSLP
jgi:hypothetical protein